MTGRRLAALLLHAFFPVSCPVCGQLGEILCESCLASLLRPEPPCCLLCEKNFPCSEHPDAPALYAASLYDEGKIKEILLALKYGGFRALAPSLGQGMARLWERPDVDLLIPVPLHLESKRGYNQAFEIARGSGRRWGIRAADLTRWSRVLPPRAGLNQAERLALRPNAFTISPALKGLRVALVDDVCTTGSTLACLTAACEAAGAKVKGAYVVAKTSFLV